jgi:hypothetical protein
MYHQLAEIHAIATMQLAECARWHLSNPTPDVAHAVAGWRGPAMEPSVTRMAPPPLTDISPQSSLRQQGSCAKLLVHQWDQGEPNSHRRHSRDPKGTGADAPRSGSCDVPLMLHFQAPADTLGTPIESCAASSTTMPPTMRWPNFNQP